MKYLVNRLNDKITALNVNMNSSGESASFEMTIGDFKYTGKIYFSNDEAIFDDHVTMNWGSDDTEVDANIMFQVIDAKYFLDEVHDDWANGKELSQQDADYERELTNSHFWSQR